MKDNNGTPQKKLHLSQLGYVNKKINSRMKLSDLLNVIMDIARDMINAEGSSLILADLETDDLIFNIVVGEKGDIIQGEKIPKGKGIAGSVAQSGAPLIVNDAQNDPRHFKEIDTKTIFTTRNILCVPMNVMGKLVGVLEVVNAIGREGFSEWDKKLLMYIADQAAIAIDNRQLYDDLRCRIDELTALYDISQSISLTEQKDNIFHTLIRSIAFSIGAEKGSIIFQDPQRNDLIIKASYGLPEGVENASNIDMLESIAGYVFRSGDPLLVSDINRELPPPLNANREHYTTKSFISVPIKHKSETIGVLSLADKKNRKNFDSFDLRVLSTISNQVAETYTNLMFQRDEEHQRRLAQEIDIASELQRKILPVIPKSIGTHQLAAFNRPAKEIGGDFYDYFNIDDSKYAILVADVSGKGIPAALFMGTARNVLRAERRINNQPRQLFINSNKYIYEDSESGMFVTVFYMLIDTHNRIITYGSAGHNDQILIKCGTREIIKLNANGKPLGMHSDSDYEEKVVIYEPGDMVVLFTDGVLEHLGSSDIDVGEKKLIDVALRYCEDDPGLIIDHFRKSMNSTEIDSDFIDDFTLLAIKL